MTVLYCNGRRIGMSALGQKRTCALQIGMSALHPKADMCSALGHVRFVPIADILPLIRLLRRRVAKTTREARGRVSWPS